MSLRPFCVPTFGYLTKPYFWVLHVMPRCFIFATVKQQ